MRRDYKTAVQVAVHALYSRDENEMADALMEILELLDPEVAELMHDNEDAAMAKVNSEEIPEEDEIETTSPDELFGG